MKKLKCNHCGSNSITAFENAPLNTMGGQYDNEICIFFKCEDCKNISNYLFDIKRKKYQYSEHLVVFGDVRFRFRPTSSDEWFSNGDYDFHYCEEYNEICVYKVVLGKDGHLKADTSTTIHSQKIRQ